MRTQERRNAGREKAGNESRRRGGMLKRRETGKKRYRKGGMQEREDAEPKYASFLFDRRGKIKFI